MRDPNLAMGAAAAFLFLLAGCGEVFVSTSGAGAEGGSGGAPMGGSSGQGAATTGSSQGGGGARCDALPGANACATCLHDTCEEQYCACADEDACLGIFECLSGGNILEYCWQTNAPGIALAGKLLVCGDGECGDCKIEPISECEACQYEHCPAEVNACFSKGACLTYLDCRADCKASGGTDVTCGNMCYGDGSGVSQASKLVMCSKSSCAESCPQ